MLDRILIGSSAEPTDANFKNVTLLLHGDGSNGAQNNTFIDSSTNNFTITRNGNTTQGSFSPYGSNWSNYFDGSGDYLSLADNAALQMGSGDFTIEFWWNPSSISGYQTPYEKGYTGSGGLLLQTGAGDGKIVVYASGSAVITASTAVTVGVWNHMALVRNGTSLVLYLNGVSVGSATNSTNFNSTGSAGIGANVSGGGAGTYPITGYLSNVRVVKGAAVYTSAFTPPTQPLTAITNTSLLTCAYNRFRDGSTNNFTITANGDVKVTNFAPFAPSSAYSTTTNGGSAYFDGNDYLNYSQTAITGNFTLEHWLYLTSTSNQPYMFGNQISGIQTEVQGGNIIVYYASGDLIATTGGTVTPNQWYHVAVVRNGSTTTLYLNGVNVGSTTTSYTMSAATFYIGTASTAVGNSTYSTNGYITDCRIVTSAVYTSNFTPPTAPLTSITNTSFLLNATNAAIFDNSMKNDLETVGNAQISTSVKKFGTGSMYFDGSGDYLDTLSTYGIGGSEAYTIEGWIYPTSVTGRDFCIYETRVGPGFVLFIDGGTGGYLRVFDSSAGLQTASTTAISANTWTHFAMVRQVGSSTNTFYVNGTSAGTFTLSSFAGPSRVRIGAREDAAQAFVGYIDDLRITKGVARYTANFTPPTAPFPNK